jgi:hypothetical protein
MEECMIKYLALAAGLLAPVFAHAQTDSLRGKWAGTLENWPHDNGYGARDLVIESPDSCRWGIGGKGKAPGPAKSCKISQVNGVSRVQLETSADSTVTLSLQGADLVGAFQLKRGISMYHIRMQRVP